MKNRVNNESTEYDAFCNQIKEILTPYCDISKGEKIVIDEYLHETIISVWSEEKGQDEIEKIKLKITPDKISKEDYETLVSMSLIYIHALRAWVY